MTDHPPVDTTHAELALPRPGDKYRHPNGRYIVVRYVRAGMVHFARYRNAEAAHPLIAGQGWANMPMAAFLDAVQGLELIREELTREQ
jgi:hypothetical protein